MKKLTPLFATVGITVIMISLSFPQTVYSNPAKSDSPKKFGIGFQGAPFPIFGLSVNYNLNENLGLQGIGVMGIDVDFLALRALYRFRNQSRYNIYANGLLGVFRDDDVQKEVFAPEETDEAMGFGLGGGFEYFFSGLPRVGWNIELDFIRINFEEKWWKYHYKAFSLIMIGLGVHYYF